MGALWYVVHSDCVVFLGKEVELIIVQVDVIVTICDYLDIWCLTIKHPYHEGDELKKQS